MRIGVAADLHRSAEDGSDLPDKLLDAFATAQLIVLCGDIGVAGTIRRLEKVAPVVAVRNPASDEDGGGKAPSITEVIRPPEAGLTFGVSFSLSPPLGIEDGRIVASGAGVRAGVELQFGTPADVVLFGSTHFPIVAHADGVLFVNPGSPTFAERPSVALLDASGGTCHVEIVDVA